MAKAGSMSVLCLLWHSPAALLLWASMVALRMLVVSTALLAVKMCCLHGTGATGNRIEPPSLCCPHAGCATSPNATLVTNATWACNLTVASGSNCIGGCQGAANVTNPPVATCNNGKNTLTNRQVAPAVASHWRASGCAVDSAALAPWFLSNVRHVFKRQQTCKLQGVKLSRHLQLMQQLALPTNNRKLACNED
jgi:hypothetical protein